MGNKLAYRYLDQSFGSFLQFFSTIPLLILIIIPNILFLVILHIHKLFFDEHNLFISQFINYQLIVQFAKHSLDLDCMNTLRPPVSQRVQAPLQRVTAGMRYVLCGQKPTSRGRISKPDGIRALFLFFLSFFIFIYIYIYI